MPPWKKALIIVALLFAISAGGYFVVPAVVDFIDRGQRLTVSPDLVDRTVQVQPEILAEQASQTMGRPVDVAAYAAARMVRSEEPRESDEVKALLVHVAINDANTHGWSLLHTLTVSSVGSRSGFFGEQTSRRYSTRKDPYVGDLLIAEQVIAARAAGGADPTGGAVKFYNRGPLLTSDPPSEWADEGLTGHTVDGAPARLVFFS